MAKLISQIDDSRSDSTNHLTCDLQTLRKCLATKCDLQTSSCDLVAIVEDQTIISLITIISLGMEEPQ